ncbi:tail fiber domain-containing protein [Geobacter sp. SVR]|uniref:tail fiber domain-containing protein n=1 Tax=Geobacter sp. SVR TaxID=2495594 RepID=UPI00143EFBFA|nr:tail fiber domain-containing protein [Geobacter sp. SVR]BCS54052.1 hypothetical protein GSVR_23600 [Geobacter sp. SVR]GCF87535.1 hypothetical protein GSbR_41350 [Geobacter sp. SVR]
MQYSQYTVSVTKGSATVIGQPGCKFLANVAPGNAFKVKGSPVVYTVSEVTDDTTFILSVPFAEASTSSIQYQVTRDYTPNFGLAEINVGDQDWPTHLTQQTIRKIDAALGAIFIGAGSGNVVTNGSSTTVTATVAGDFREIKVGSYLTANGVSRTVVDKDFETNSTITVNAPVDWSNNGNGYSWTYSLGNAFRDAEINVGLAKTSAETAVVAAETATDAAGTATTKADIATDKAGEASDAAVAAADSAHDAEISEQAASASKTNAAASAHDAGVSAATAVDRAEAAKNSEDTAKCSEDSAAASAQAAKDSKDAAHLSEVAAAGSSQAAKDSKDAAHLSEVAAAGSAQDADESATDAASSARDAASSALSLSSALYSFRETFLGELATDPFVDGNGNPIKDGATYSNTVSGKIRVYIAETMTWDDYDKAAQAASSNANLSALSAAGSAGDALNSKRDAEAAAATATSKAGDAAGSALAAAGSAVAADGAAATATSKAGDAVGSAQAAAGSAVAAGQSAQAAAQSAVEAATVVAAGIPVASQTVRGGVKVDGITITITNETISAAVPAVSSLVQDTTHRFVTDTEKTTWNAKQNSLTAGVDYLTPSGQVQPDWNASTGKGAILNKPSFAIVATSGSYTDLSNKPTIPAAQVQSDWNAVAGMGTILNKPTLATVATSGSYNDLVNRPSLATVATTGSYTDLSNKPVIPAAQVQSDWNAVAGMGTILNKPTLATVATSGSYSDLANRPSLAAVATTGSYTDLSNKPVIPAAQVQSDWNAVAGMGQILNKPTLGTAAAKDVAPSGNASVSQVVLGNDTRLSDSRPASDVQAWAKTASKPTYTYSEVGAAASSHSHDYATHRGEGSNFIDNAYAVYDAYRGGWRASNDLYVAYAYSSGAVPASGISGQNGMWTSGARPGAYKLYRNDNDSAYNVQTTWEANKGGYWSLRGYNGDSFHADCYVAYAGQADYAGQGRTVYDNGAYSGAAAWREPSGMYVYYSARSSRANGNFYIDDNYGCSVVGVYNASKFQGVFAMGDAYKLPADGSSPGGMYGIAWSHPNAGGIAGYLSSHGALYCQGGNFMAAISTNIVCAGVFNNLSDERLKTNWRSLPDNFVERLAKVKYGVYDRTDIGVTQVGASAQSLQILLPEAVETASNEDQTLSISYGNAALVSAIKLAEEVVELKDRVTQLERIIAGKLGGI